jgi:hypothetical protein
MYCLHLQDNYMTLHSRRQQFRYICKEMFSDMGKQRHLYSTVTFFPAFSHIFCVMFHPLEQTLETVMPLTLYLCCEFVTVHLVKWKTVTVKAVLHRYNKTDVKLGCKVCGCVAILGCTIPGFLFSKLLNHFD